jgi:hypothetical protein
MSLVVSQAQGTVTVDVCGVNGLLCADVELFLVENGQFQWPALSRNSEPNFNLLMLGFIQAARSPDLNTSCRQSSTCKKHKAQGLR